MRLIKCLRLWKCKRKKEPRVSHLARTILFHFYYRVLKSRHHVHEHTQKAHHGKCIQLTGDLGSMNLRYVACADCATDPVIVIIVAVINAVINVVALRHGGRAISVTDLVQIAHAHGGSDARRHHWHDLSKKRKLILPNTCNHCKEGCKLDFD